MFGKVPKFEKFPVLFPVSREFECGDGFDNDCVRHQQVLPWWGFPEIVQMPSNWRRRGGGFRLSRRVTGRDASFRRSCLCPRNPVSRSQDRPAADLCFERKLLLKKPEHLMLAGPLGGQIAKASYSHAIGQPSLDSGLD